jgi:hypothetical protein
MKMDIREEQSIASSEICKEIRELAERKNPKEARR